MYEYMHCIATVPTNDTRDVLSYRLMAKLDQAIE